MWTWTSDLKSAQLHAVSHSSEDMTSRPSASLPLLIQKRGGSRGVVILRQVPYPSTWQAACHILAVLVFQSYRIGLKYLHHAWIQVKHDSCGQWPSDPSQHCSQ